DPLRCRCGARSDALDLTRCFGHAPRGRQQALAEARGHGSLHAACEERLTERRFELRETPAHRGLCRLEPVRRCAHAPGFCHGQKQLDLVPRYMHWRILSFEFRQFPYLREWLIFAGMEAVASEGRGPEPGESPCPSSSASSSS